MNVTMNRIHKLPVSTRIARFCRRAGVQTIDSALRIHVSQILADYGRTNPPFDAWQICKTRNVEVEVRKLTGCDGRLIPVPGGYVAQVHSEDSRERQGFSACHELGHTFFSDESTDETECELVPSDREYRLEEAVCNSFAAEVLMPVDAFTSDVKSRSQSWKEISKIAGLFGVSGEATINRILDLDLWKGVHIILRVTSTGGLEETFTLESFRPCVSLTHNPIGTAMLVQKIMDWLHSGGAEVFRMSYPCEANVGLKLPVQLSGHYFSNRRGRFARLFAAILPHRPEYTSAAFTPASSQGSLFLC